MPRRRKKNTQTIQIHIITFFFHFWKWFQGSLLICSIVERGQRENKTTEEESRRQTEEGEDMLTCKGNQETENGGERKRRASEGEKFIEVLQI